MLIYLSVGIFKCSYMLVLVYWSHIKVGVTISGPLKLHDHKAWTWSAIREDSFQWQSIFYVTAYIW